MHKPKVCPKGDEQDASREIWPPQPIQIIKKPQPQDWGFFIAFYIGSEFDNLDARRLKNCFHKVILDMKFPASKNQLSTAITYPFFFKNKP